MTTRLGYDRAKVRRTLSAFLQQDFFAVPFDGSLCAGYNKCDIRYNVKNGNRMASLIGHKFSKWSEWPEAWNIHF